MAHAGGNEMAPDEMAPDAVRFGLILHTTADEPAKPVGIARQAADLGFDYLGVHRDVLAGQPVSFETMTLVTWLAARTSRIQLVTNVLAVPNRHPVLLAKAAATLELLSAGRLVLGLGAGGAVNDQLLRAVGLRPGSPAAKVAALEEVIDILRGAWRGEPFSHDGQHFRLDKAQVGPAPICPIPVWLGAYGNRMLALTGRKADGWLPSSFYLAPDAAAGALRRVQAAAAQAGRDPAELTYAYNVGIDLSTSATTRPGMICGPVGTAAKSLAALARDGFGVLNLWPAQDTAQQRHRLGTELIPAVRNEL
jgi:alkanesulfonate monooxygenase SsuD/methylene tetrahydromethanopterin reductase-like flavin-dependent oxidoreductase (luciferase family)